MAGGLAETNFQYRGSLGLPLQDLNQFSASANFPVFDYRNRFSGRLISVKSSVPSDPNAGPNMATYANGFDDMVAVRRPGTFTSSVAQLNAATGLGLNQADAIRRSYLAVNSDHVEAVRVEVDQKIRLNPDRYDPLLDVMLADVPATVGVNRYSSMQALRNATRESHHFSIRVRQRDRQSSDAIPVPRYQQRGAAGGVVISAGMDVGRLLLTENGPDAGHFAIDVGLGGLGAGGGAAIETAIANQFSRSMLQSTIASEGTSAITPLLGRGLGGGVAGGVIAPLTTLGGMGIEDLFYGGDNGTSDYAARGTRAFVSGATSGFAGALVAGAVGAIAGNIVGFIVGIGIYYIVDETAGESIEARIRKDMGEGGCPRPPEARPAPPELRIPATCFPALTRLTMATGELRGIAEIRSGERVLAYAPESKKFVGARVERVHAHPPAAYRKLQLEDGSVLRVTAEHPLHAAGQWRRAGDLAPGDLISVLNREPDAVAITAVLSVEEIATSEPVYNLTVEEPHTFFADGVLAHNKNI